MTERKRTTKKISRKSNKCIHCEKREKEDIEQEEINFAVLLILVPIMVIVLFKHMGLF